MGLRGFFAHRWTRLARRIARFVVVVLAVALAVSVVLGFTTDIGPSLRALAERQGSRLIERPMHIGQLSVKLLAGRFEVRDLVIEGLTPESAPFFEVERISVSMLWRPLLVRRIVLNDIEIVDWKMAVEYLPDGTHSFPRINRGSTSGRSAWTTTMQYVRAHRGEFTYEDRGLPWSIVTRNLDVVVGRTNDEYRGRAVFSDGRVAIQQFVPFGAAMASTFKIDGGRVVLDHIDLQTDGAKSTLVGDVDMAHWPEQMYHVRSEIDFNRMRELFWAKERFSLTGTGHFDGTFHLFKDALPDGTPRNGREFKGTFTSDVAGLNDWRFPNLAGAVRWTPDLLDVTDASSGFHGGTTQFDYRLAPLGRPNQRSTHRFDLGYEQVDVSALSEFMGLQGIRFAGAASGRNRLEWPSGQWAEHRGEGELHITPPPGVEMMTARMRIDAIAARGEVWGPFSPHIPGEPVPTAADLAYTFDSEWVDLSGGRFATESTHVAFEGRTAYGERSTLPFQVASNDWQESDRLLAGILTAFGAPTGAIPIEGYGTFDGTMTGDFRRPRIEGAFTGERMKAWDVVWGAAAGTAVIENNYVDAKDVVIRSGDATIRTNGRFSAGFPRRDGGEELNAVLRIDGWPVSDLRHAFQIDDYNFDGRLSGEFHLYGAYLTPFGFGSMTITEGKAYGQAFTSATTAVRFEGTGARLDTIQMTKGDGRGTGAAFIGWDGTYSFEFEGRGLPLEAVDLAEGQSRPPVTGLFDFRAGGSGQFDHPRYDVRATLRDLFVADEGIGQVIGDVAVNDKSLTVTLEGASPRLAVSGSGRVALTEDYESDLTFNVASTSLDPYLRLIRPELSPYTTAIAGGNVRVTGSLADRNRVKVDATVDRLDLGLFDYPLTNEGPIRLSLADGTVRVANMRLVGQDTALDVVGTATLADAQMSVKLNGAANLGVLQALLPNMTARGRATLTAAFEGAFDSPSVVGSMAIADGRIRHFNVPHALENASGTVTFDTRTITLDGLEGRLGGGPVAFGGSIGLDGYRVERLDVTLNGTDMRLRFPEGMRSLVDASLMLQGTPDAATLSGQVAVRDAVYTGALTTTGNLLGVSGDAGAVPASTGSATPVPLSYDIRITAPSTLQVVNSTMELVGSADLTLQGTFDQPEVVGDVDIERGDVRFESRRYRITRGTIDFNNPARLEPFIDIDAETRVRVPGENYRVTVRVSGPSNDPSLTFASDPPLSDVEVMALLFSDVAPRRDVEFNRYNTDITPQQQLLREGLARQLTGSISSEVGKVVEQAFGVDTFQITPMLGDPNQQSSRLDPTARLTIGKRLSDRVYLTYSRSLSSSTRDQIILVEIDQTDKSSWILSRNEDGTYAVDFRLRRQF